VRLASAGLSIDAGKIHWPNLHFCERKIKGRIFKQVLQEGYNRESYWHFDQGFHGGDHIASQFSYPCIRSSSERSGRSSFTLSEDFNISKRIAPAISSWPSPVSYTATMS
jgi:hypothetical protein